MYTPPSSVLAARVLMVALVSTQSELHFALHVVRPCGGEDESSESMRALYLQFSSPSRSLAAVVLGALESKIQRALLPLLPSHDGSQ